MDDRQRQTYDAIVARCKDQIPSIDITKHIKPGTLRVAKNTLDGIEFKAEDPADLEAELGGRMKLHPGDKSPKPVVGALSFDTTRAPRPANATMTSMNEEPGHWALKASFGATVGVGFREQWRPPPPPRPALLPTTSYGSQRISLGFGETGRNLKFTALHAAVAASICSIHIDERGFVVSTPEGAVVTATFWGHLANELLLKTEFRDWLKGAIGDTAVGPIVVEVVNRLSLRFPDAENRFAGLQGKMNRITGPGDVKGIGKAFLPIGVSADLAYFRNSTVQANYYWHDGQRTLTISWGGTFEKFGSK
ncbi:MAG TPA: hypothetical protein VMN43_03505 [Aestuariivirgaceae bacterium]|nr:hypothetical protein [Aestuariivirgaceae bacterium]